MTTMISELYDALKDAGASEQKAKAAATALAQHENRFDRIDSELALLRKDVEGLRREMDARFDLLRKDMDTNFDLFSKNMDAKFDLFSKDTDARFDLFSKDTDAKFDLFSKDMEALENRLMIKMGGLMAISIGIVAALVKLL